MPQLVRVTDKNEKLVGIGHVQVGAVVITTGNYNRKTVSQAFLFLLFSHLPLELLSHTGPSEVSDKSHWTLLPLGTVVRLDIHGTLLPICALIKLFCNLEIEGFNTKNNCKKKKK